MTPPHGLPISDSGEREAAGGDDYVTRDAMKLAVLKHESGCHESGGALYELREWVTKLAMRQAAVTAVALLLNGAGLVVLAWWLNTRLPAPPQPRVSGGGATLINQAQAQAKGTP